MNARLTKWRYPALAVLAEAVADVLADAKPKSPYVVADLVLKLRSAVTVGEVNAAKVGVEEAKAKGLLCPVGLVLLRHEYAASLERTRIAS